MVKLLRARPSVTVVLAFLAISAGLVLGLAREALAHYSFRCSTSPCGSTQVVDYDRYVPEFDGAPLNGHYDNILGNTWTYQDFHSHRWIEYDGVEMRDECANAYTWNALYAHERAHSRGWSHGEGPARLNAAYNPVIYTPCHN